MTTETAPPPAGGGSKAYDPKTVEERLYRFWEEGGFFQPRLVPGRMPFTIIMPPPNVTGALHLGHALPATMEDILIRWHRMKGDPTLWLPGEDHAGIAGQNVVEKLLAEEGLTRHDLGREKFVERVWEWMHKYRHVIADQHRRLGASCDWTRERFTMDAGPVRGVRTTFVNLYNKGLIYRGERIINWCPRCMTALSDLEVDHEETEGHLWYVRYPLKPLPSASSRLPGFSAEEMVQVILETSEAVRSDPDIPDELQGRDRAELALKLVLMRREKIVSQADRRRLLDDVALRFLWAVSARKDRLPGISDEMRNRIVDRVAKDLANDGISDPAKSTDPRLRQRMMEAFELAMAQETTTLSRSERMVLFEDLVSRVRHSLG